MLKLLEKVAVVITLPFLFLLKEKKKKYTRLDEVSLLEDDREILEELSKYD